MSHLDLPAAGGRQGPRSVRALARLAPAGAGRQRPERTHARFHPFPSQPQQGSPDWRCTDRRRNLPAARAPHRRARQSGRCFAARPGPTRRALAGSPRDLSGGARSSAPGDPPSAGRHRASRPGDRTFRQSGPARSASGGGGAEPPGGLLPPAAYGDHGGGVSGNVVPGPLAQRTDVLVRRVEGPLVSHAGGATVAREAGPLPRHGHWTTCRHARLPRKPAGAFRTQPHPRRLRRSNPAAPAPCRCDSTCGARSSATVRSYRPGSRPGSATPWPGPPWVPAWRRPSNVRSWKPRYPRSR